MAARVDRATLAGAGMATAGAIATLAAVDDGPADRVSEVVLVVALVALCRSAFRVIDRDEPRRISEPEGKRG